MTLRELLKPERNENESFAAYKARRKNANQHVKQLAKGTLFWNSYQLGTYRKADQRD